MALVKCKERNQQIGSNAKACPGCCAQAPNRMGFPTRIVLCLVGTAVLVGLSGCSERSEAGKDAVQGESSRPQSPKADPQGADAASARTVAAAQPEPSGERKFDRANAATRLAADKIGGALSKTETPGRGPLPAGYDELSPLATPISNCPPGARVVIRHLSADWTSRGCYLINGETVSLGFIMMGQQLILEAPLSSFDVFGRYVTIPAEELRLRKTGMKAYGEYPSKAYEAQLASLSNMAGGKTLKTWEFARVIDDDFATVGGNPTWVRIVALKMVTRLDDDEPTAVVRLFGEICGGPGDRGQVFLGVSEDGSPIATGKVEAFDESDSYGVALNRWACNG